jgi:hypothetical protein
MLTDMANLVASVETFYGTLTASAFPNSTRPPISLTTAPVVTTAGAQLRPPYVTCELLSAGVEDCFESSIETTRLTFIAVANGAHNAQQIIDAIRFNGLAASAAGGFDNRAALAALTDGTLLGIFPEGPPEIVQDRSLDRTGATVHTGTMRYRVQVERATS